MMNFEPDPIDNDVSQTSRQNISVCPIENSIVQTIVEGSGGPENQEMTDPGLRFVRYLLSISRPARQGFVPNFKDMSYIHKVARDFISRCGGAHLAAQTMNNIIACE
jgi:hypothetical protein